MSMIITLLTGLLFVAMIVLFAVVLPLAIYFSVRTSRANREKLAGRIEKLRLGKMLSLLGIDIDTYIARERGVDIHQHMSRCKSCSNLDECDERLEQGDITADDIGFCNNEQSLQELSRTLK